MTGGGGSGRSPDPEQVIQYLLFVSFADEQEAKVRDEVPDRSGSDTVSPVITALL